MQTPATGSANSSQGVLKRRAVTKSKVLRKSALSEPQTIAINAAASDNFAHSFTHWCFEDNGSSSVRFVSRVECVNFKVKQKGGDHAEARRLGVIKNKGGFVE